MKPKEKAKPQKEEISESKENTEAVMKTPPAAVFTKKQLMSSERFADRRDMLNVLLDDKKSYTLSETERIINDFMKGKVK